MIELNHGRVLVKPAITETRRDKVIRGTVIQSGLRPIDSRGNDGAIPIDAGDTILFIKYAGHDVKLDGEDLIIISYNDIIMKVVP